MGIKKITSGWATLSTLARLYGLAVGTLRNSYAELVGEWAIRRHAGRVYVWNPALLQAKCDAAIRAAGKEPGGSSDSGDELIVRGLRRLGETDPKAARDRLNRLAPFLPPADDAGADADAGDDVEDAAL